MRYTVETDREWSEGDPADLLSLARHHRIPVEQNGDIVVVAQDGPGWVRIPEVAIDFITAIDGATLEEVTQWQHREKVADLLECLYRSGLLFVGGRTGLRAHRGVDEPSAAEASAPRAILLKLTGACDMACDYCYDYDSQRWHGRADSDLARRLITECLRPGNTLTLMFHGGEPMLRFKQIQELVDFAECRAGEIGANVRHTVQTNGLHLSATSVEYFRAHRFTVGISLDGPRQVHDRHRVDHAGRGTFDRIIRNFEEFGPFMREEVGYISVVGPETTYEMLEETWEFFRDLGILSWKLLPADAEGRAIDKPETNDFRSTFVQFLSARLDDVLNGCSDAPYIANLTQLMEPFLTPERRNLCMSMPCGAGTDLLVLDAVGGVRACDCSYHPAFELLPAKPPKPMAGHRRMLPLIPVGTNAGRPRPDSLADQSPNRREQRPYVQEIMATDGGIVRAAQATSEALALRSREEWLVSEAPCAQCPWLHQCAGTCPARALTNNGSIYSIDDLQCRTRLALFPRILADVSAAESRLRAYYGAAKIKNGAVLSVGDLLT